MATTTIRVDIETHRRLQELSESAGTSLIDTVRNAAEALRRQHFADRVTGELESLRNDPGAWNDYLSDAEATSVTDGLR